MTPSSLSATPDIPAHARRPPRLQPGHPRQQSHVTQTPHLARRISPQPRNLPSQTRTNPREFDDRQDHARTPRLQTTCASSASTTRSTLGRRITIPQPPHSVSCSIHAISLSPPLAMTHVPMTHPLQCGLRRIPSAKKHSDAQASTTASISKHVSRPHLSPS